LQAPQLYGPLADLFLQEPHYFSPTQAGTPLLPLRNTKGLPTSLRDFRYKTVRVDSLSSTVFYTPKEVGFDAGAEVPLPLDTFLEMGFRYERQRLWRVQVQKERRQEVVQRRQGGTSKLEWSMPFSTRSKALRRIIGEEGPTLKINGERTITIAGKSEWTAGEIRTLAGRPSRFPALSMDQESKFTVQGKVGELIDLRITQDTKSLNTNLGDQLADQIRLDYKADNDDAIFQEVQAGNTTLSLPGSRFVAFRQQNKGLFGLRTKGKLGPLGFTAIASHEKSKSNRRSFRGGSLVDTLEIRDHLYLRNTYFFLDGVYRERLSDYHEAASARPSDYNPDDAIDINSLQVFINDFNTNNDPEQRAEPGVARVDLSAAVEQSGFVERGTWHLLDPDEDYSVVPQLGFVVMRRQVNDREALAVSYRTVGGQQFGVPVRAAEEDSLQLKLIKPREARPGFPTWDFEWKNVYRISTGFNQGRQFEADKIRVQILKEVAGREPEGSQKGKSYLQIMGLDLHGQDPGTPPDQIIDADYVGLDELRGTLILPDLRPFDPQNPKYQGLDEKIPEIYESQQQREQVEASRYIIQVISSSGQRRISLQQLGVNTESVEVRLNGQGLQRGVDFNVDFVGNVNFIGAKADEIFDPGADLEITYETQDLLGIGSQQKTLVGLRGEYEFLDGDGVLGSTILYNTERSSERRVRVGNEPARTVVWDLDLKANFEAPWLTRVVDAMPLLKTTSVSKVDVLAEVAQSRPNLNTKGPGFIDDFEGSERPDLLSVFRNRWTPSSRPEAFGAQERGKLIWYNPFDRIQRIEIWPQQEDQVDTRNSDTDVLVLELTPGANTIEPWGGVMTAFTGGVRDFSLSKFLDVWLRGSEGKLHIDLGSISEDFIADGILNTEDIPLPGRSTGDGQIAPSEDTGIDGRFLDAELNYYLELAGIDTVGLSREDKQARFADAYPERDPKDPEGDDWTVNQRRRDDNSHINGTEGNSADDSGSLPDTEDLNNDGLANTNNDFYHYTIDLANDPHVPGTESNLSDPQGSWRLFRLPLYGAQVERVGLPDSSRVEYARLMIEGTALANPALKVEIAQMEIIGNEWQEDDILSFDGNMPLLEEEAFNISVIGTDENQEYEPPKGVRRNRDQTSRTREREQSLVLAYQDLEPGHQASATKVLSRNANYTKYRRLRMFFHGDKVNTDYALGDSSEVEAFLRFGIDSTNYYEFSTKVFPEWDKRNEVDIDLLLMSRLKAILQETPEEELLLNEFGQAVVVIDSLVEDLGKREGEPAMYRVRGNPSMQQIKQMTLGVRNRGANQAWSGEVYADEMRLDDARNDAGVAAFAKVRTQLADFMNIDSEILWQQEDFRTISSTNRNNSDLNTSFNTTTNVHQILPGSWNFSIPLKAQFSQRVSEPRFGPNSDVELTKSQKHEQRTQNTKEFYEVSVSKRSSKTWLLRWSLDQMTLRLSTTQNRAFSPTQPVNNREAQTGNFNYRMPLPKPSLPVLKWVPGFMPKGFREMRLRYLPSTLNYAANINRLKQASLRRTDADTTFQKDFTMRETYTAKANPFQFLSGNYSLQINRDLRKKLDIGQFSFGREVNRTQQADVNFNPRLSKWLDQSYTFQAKFEENNDPRTRRAQAVVDSTTGQSIQSSDITTDNNLTARVTVRLPILLKTIGATSRSSRRAVSGSRQQPSNRKAETRPTRRGKPEEKADQKASEVTNKRRPIFFRRFIYFTGGYIEPLTVNWRRNNRGRNFNLRQRPSLLFQLGLDDQLKVERVAVGLTQQDQRDRSTRLDGSSGLKLPLGFSIKANYEEQLTRRSGSSQERLRVRRDETFPKATLSWQRADRIPLLRRFMNNGNVSVNFTRTKGQEGEGDLGRDNLISQSENEELRFTWSGRWRWGPRTKFELSRADQVDLDFELGRSADEEVTTGAPPIRGSSGRQRRTSGFEIRYDLKPRNLPLFGKLKSDINLVLDMDIESEVRLSATGDAKRTPIGRTNKWKATFKGDYKFSDKFRGQGLIRLENNHNGLTDKTRKIRELRLSGTLIFR